MAQFNNSQKRIGEEFISARFIIYLKRDFSFINSSRLAFAQRDTREIQISVADVHLFMNAVRVWV